MVETHDPLQLPIEHHVDQLGTSRVLPAAAVTVCVARYSEAGPLLRSALNRAGDGRMFDSIDERLFFRALHIVGACRDPLGFQPLLRFLQKADEDGERLLGDAVTETLPSIVAGVFDGDPEALFETVVTPGIEPFTRSALLEAAAFLTWDGRIDRQQMVRFLERFDSDRLAPDRDFIWFEWARTIACLGLRDMVPAVAAAAARGSIAEGWERKAFDERLADAERAPRDATRIKEEFHGYFDDVVSALQQIKAERDDYIETTGFWPGPSIGAKLIVNPWRKVGKKDPCLCGSGKKAKRCCMAA